MTDLESSALKHSQEQSLLQSKLKQTLLNLQNEKQRNQHLARTNTSINDKYSSFLSSSFSDPSPLGEAIGSGSGNHGSNPGLLSQQQRLEEQRRKLVRAATQTLNEVNKLRARHVTSVSETT